MSGYRRARGSRMNAKFGRFPLSHLISGNLNSSHMKYYIFLPNRALTSPQPNGFPSPPRVSCPAYHQRFALRGPLPRRERRGRRVRGFRASMREIIRGILSLTLTHSSLKGRGNQIATSFGAGVKVRPAPGNFEL
jgi:hypothetical protein